MSLNSHWIQKYQPSNLKVQKKNVRFSTKTDVFFDRPNLTAGHFGTKWSSDTLCTSFERCDQYLIGSRKLKGVTPLLLWAHALLKKPFYKVK